MYFVSFLKSIKFERHYIGSTSNLDRRLANHNTGKVRSTKAYKHWKIIYRESFENKSEAFNREKQIKSYKGRIAFKKLISSTE